MALLDIVTIGKDDKILHDTTKRIRKFDAELHKLLDSMIETMRNSEGAGLAAPQIGLNKRISVLEWPKDPEDAENTMETFELINPEIIRTKGSEVGMEGCLSLPGMAADVERATYVLLRAQDRFGKQYRLKAYDFLARIIQHEVDHLQGVIMTEKAVQLYRIELKEKEKGKEDEEDDWVAVPIENAFISNTKVPLLNIFGGLKKKKK